MNVLQQVAGQVAALDLGYKPNLKLGAPKVLYLLGADSESITKTKPAGTTVIYQGRLFYNCIVIFFYKFLSVVNVRNSMPKKEIFKNSLTK